jgi:hypothetical protein
MAVFIDCVNMKTRWSTRLIGVLGRISDGVPQGSNQPNAGIQKQRG